MKRKNWMILAALIIVAVVACSIGQGATRQEQREILEESGLIRPSRSSPQAAVQADFEAYMKRIGTPYKDVRYEVIANDGYVATVRTTGLLLELNYDTGVEEWHEKWEESKCHNVGGEWGCKYDGFGFRLTAREVAPTTRAAQTAAAQRQATTDAFEAAQDFIRTMTATAEFAKTATAESQEAAQATAAVATQATLKAALGYTEGFLQVVNTNGGGLSVRAGPGTNNVCITVALEGQILKVLDGPKNDEQKEKCGEKICQWWYVRLVAGVEGWVSDEFTVAISPEEAQ